MNCPRCNDSLIEQARSGVQVDVCPRCRGIWLDRGELEKLAQYEGRYRDDDDDDDDDDDMDWDEGGRGPRRGRRRGGFFENLMDMFGGD